MRRCLLFSLVIIIAVPTAKQETCSVDVDLSIPLRVVSHGSLGGFYSIAQGISDAIRPGISKETMNEVVHEVFHKKSADKAVPMIIQERKGPIVFTAFGIAIAMGSLLFGLLVLFLRCCSKRSEKTVDTSTTAQLLFLALLTCSFVFVLTGVIIYNQSSSKLFSSVENLPSNTKGIMQEFNAMLKNALKSVVCFTGRAVNSTISEVTENVQTLPKYLQDEFRNFTGIDLFDQVNSTAIQASITASQKQCKSITDSIKDVENSGPGPGCTAKLGALKTIIDSLTEKLEKFEKEAPTKNITDEISEKVFKELNDTTQAELDRTTKHIRGQWDDVRTKAESYNTISDTLNETQNTVDNVIGKVSSSSIYALAKTLVATLVTIPAIIALLFIVSTALFIMLYIYDRKDESQKDSKSSFVPYSILLSMAGFYLLIILAWFVITLSSIEYLGGSLVTASCKTLRDPSVSGLSSFDMDVKLPVGDSIRIYVGNMLRQCRNDNTLWIAVGANSVLNSTTLINNLGLPSIKDETLEIVNKVKGEMRKFQDEMRDRKKQIKNHLDYVDDLITQLTPNSLSECTSVNSEATRKIHDGIASLNSSMMVIRGELEKINAALTKLLSLDTNVFDGKIDEIQAKFSDLIEKPVRKGIDNVFNELSTNLLKCRGVYNTYENLGSLICEDIGGPVHGMWASTGLCGLWFLATAIIILLVVRRNSANSQAK